jgi:hypothetical protein
MTAVMRALAPASGPKLLRIGLVQGGRVVEERVIKQRTTVTIGPSERATFATGAPNLPSPFKLFELIGGDYYLNLLDSMTGRIAFETGIQDIASLRGEAKRVGNVYRVELNEDARGKVVVGDATFLFQFVAPLQAQPRPQLPLAVKGGLASQIDWSLTIIAAFSFLLHFGFIGAMYSDWTDPLLDDDTTVGPLVDMFAHIPPVSVEDSPGAVPTGPRAPTVSATPSSGPPKSPGSGVSGPSAVTHQQAAVLAARAQAMELDILGAYGAKSAVQGALNRPDIPPVGLEDAAAANMGARAATGNDLHFGSAGGPVRPGTGRPGLTDIGNTVAVGTTTAGPDSHVHGPVTGIADVGILDPTTPVANAERTVAGLRTGFRTCYNRGLLSDPTMAGKVVVSAKISPNGEVASADSAQNTGLSSDVVQCILRKVRTATFDGPGPNGATLQIPVTFVQQGK